MLEHEIREWLESKHVSLWGNFIIQSDDGMDEAVNWWMKELASYHMFQMENRRKVDKKFGGWDVTGAENDE